jgi:hypothetical protein
MPAVQMRVVVVLSYLAACQSDKGDGPTAPETPITERASLGTYQCRIQRDHTDHSPRYWSFVTPALVKTSAGTVYMTRSEASLPAGQYLPGPAQLLVSTFDTAGAFGPPAVVPSASPQNIRGMAAAPRGDGFAAVWVEDTRLVFAAFNAAGQVALTPRDVVRGVDEFSEPKLAAGPDGAFGVVFAPPTGAAKDGRELQFAVLDDQGAIRMAPRRLTDRPGLQFTQPAATIISSATGYSMIWRDPAEMNGAIDFAAADASGAERVARRRVAAPGTAGLTVGGNEIFDPAATALVETADGYLAAWVQGERGRDRTINGVVNFGGGYSVVVLSRLDRAGVPVGNPIPLRARRDDVDEVEPTLVPFGDAVAVLWGHGTHIYACAGCVPDHRIDVMLIDPATLSPLSNVEAITNGGKTGGLLRRRVVALADTLLMAYQLTFHTMVKASSAAVSCTK